MWIVVLMLSVLALSAPQPRAQGVDDYSRGYLDGYTGRIARPGEPSPGPGYARGLQAGQDDAADDAEIDQRSLESVGRPIGHPPSTGNDND